METKKTKIEIEKVEFDLTYDLVEQKLESGNRYFPSITYVYHKDVNMKDLLDRSVLDEMRVILYKENNNI